MTCTILLVALVACTISFIYGTQSDSLLKDVLSVTGNDPGLHKTRDGNNKYGPFRKAIVPESMSHAMRRDGPTEEPKVIEQCEETNQPCALLTKKNNRYFPKSLCKCNDLTNTDCNENWEDNSANSFTWTSPYIRGEEEQYKFCSNIVLTQNCNNRQTAATISMYKTGTSSYRWSYSPNCKCDNYRFELYRQAVGNSLWKSFFVCNKDQCSSGQKCATRFTESRNNKLYANFTYPCVCSPEEKCPKPQRHEDHNLDHGSTYSSSYASTECVSA